VNNKDSLKLKGEKKKRKEKKRKKTESRKLAPFFLKKKLKIWEVQVMR